MAEPSNIDWLSSYGSTRLAEIIRAHWAARGQVVRVWAEEVWSRPEGAVWAVRSNLRLRATPRGMKARRRGETLISNEGGKIGIIP
jgi:hypothetical protein